jgi:hypothetical protein
MKKLLFIFLFLPILSFAQNVITEDLKICMPTITSNFSEEDIAFITEGKCDESDFGTKAFKFYNSNGKKFTISECPKGLTIQKMFTIFKQSMKSPPKGKSLQPIINEGNSILVERIDKKTKESLFLFLIGVTIKGKQFIIDSSTFDSLEDCKAMYAIAKKIK